MSYVLLHLGLLVFCLLTSHSLILTNFKDNLLSIILNNAKQNNIETIIDGVKIRWVPDEALDKDASRTENLDIYEFNGEDINIDHEKEKILENAKEEEKLDELKLLSEVHGTVTHNGNENYLKDPVPNIMRRAEDHRMKDANSSESSSQELGDFKEQFEELWLQKKYEALNSTPPSGDIVNMAAARPWGVKCGDPMQHDLPWGNCMLAAECEAEYRIFRGDYFCGKTTFVCCALEINSYDMYQGFDVSFEDKSLSTDSDEIKHRNKKKKKKDKKKRQEQRAKRKKKIKKNIRKIIKEINKMLQRIYINGTKQKKKKTKQLKKFIKYLKKEYKKNRKNVQGLHNEYMIKIDTALMKKLNKIRHMNQNFMKNQTFADIVVNGTINKQGARMLIQAYPELAEFIKTRRSGNTNDPKDYPKSKDPTTDYLEYDVEYGFSYY